MKKTNSFLLVKSAFIDQCEQHLNAVLDRTTWFPHRLKYQIKYSIHIDWAVNQKKSLINFNFNVKYATLYSSMALSSGLAS